MRLSILCHPSDKHYIEESLDLEASSVDKRDKHTVELSFETEDSDLVSHILAYNPSARAYLDFEDGTSSPLYIRKNIAFDD